MSGDRVERNYRAANEALDERPSSATRAAILAAAAREVRAGPRNAREPIAAPGPGRRRWPMAAAAAVLLSTLAVMMAVRTEHEMPTFTPPTATESGAPAVAPVSPAPSVTTESVPQQRLNDSGIAATSRAPSLSKERAAPSVAAAPAAPPATAGSSRDAASSAESKVTAPIAEPRAKKDETADLRTPASPPLPSAAPPVAGQRAAVAPPGEAGVSSDASAPAPARDERRRDEAATNSARAPARQEPAATGALGAAAEKPRAEADAVANELRADEWLDRIIRLRRTGRHDDADAELKRFRERYPQVQVPAEALAPSGTR